MKHAILQVRSDLWGTAKFVDSVRLPYIAPSLGGTESLIEQPTVISYWDQARPSYARPMQPDHTCCHMSSFSSSCFGRHHAACVVVLHHQPVVSCGRHPGC